MIAAIQAYILPIIAAFTAAVAGWLYARGRADRKREDEAKMEKKANDVLSKGADARADAGRRDADVIELRKSDGFKRPD